MGRYTACLVVFGLVSVLPPPAAADVQVGISGPLTGNLAERGKHLLLGAQQAVQDINSSGGINGENIELHVTDDTCDPKQAVSAANSLVSKGVVLVVGHYCDMASIATSSVYGDAGVLQISPGAMAPEYTDARPSNLVFRVSPRSDRQVEVVASIVEAHNGGQADVVVFTDRSITDVAENLIDRKLSSAGGSSDIFHVADDGRSFSGGGSPDSRKPSFVYVTDFYLLGTKAVQQYLAAKSGSDMTLIVGNWDPWPDLSGIPVNDFPKRTVLVAPPRLESYAGSADIRDKLQAKGERATNEALYTYSAFQAWAEAAKQAGSTDPSSVASRLAGGKFQTLLGEVGFDERGDISLQPGYVVYEWLSPEKGFGGGQ